MTPDDTTDVELIPVDCRTVAAGETIFLGGYTLSEVDKGCGRSCTDMAIAACPQHMGRPQIMGQVIRFCAISSIKSWITVRIPKRLLISACWYRSFRSLVHSP